MSQEQEKTYTVIALSVGGKNNKIFYSGDKVTAENFPEGNAELLVEDGHLKRNWTEEKKPAIQEAKKEKGTK